jgi:transposase-like protein
MSVRPGARRGTAICLPPHRLEKALSFARRSLAFKDSIVQTCIVHLIGHSMDFASWKHRKPIAAELKAIDRATDADVARRALEDFDAGVWGRK